MTLTGNLMVLHADCQEVARRKIPLPNYCFAAEKVNVNVGTGMEATELSSTGYSVRERERDTVILYYHIHSGVIEVPIYVHVCYKPSVM